MVFAAGERAPFEIVEREDFSDVTYFLVVHHSLMARAAKPDQFVIVMSHESGERIPLTIADFDGQPQPDHGRRHRDVWRLPGQGGRPGEVRLCRRP
jgi:hypothetical protein